MSEPTSTSGNGQSAPAAVIGGGVSAPAVTTQNPSQPIPQTQQPTSMGGQQPLLGGNQPTGKTTLAGQEWRDHIPAEYKDAPFWGSVTDTKSLVNSFANVQKLIGVEKLPAPKESWTDTEWDGFYSRLRPQTADAYKLPEGINFPKDALKAMTEESHKLGLTQHQFARLAKSEWEAYQAEHAEANKTMETRMSEFAAKLSTEHGANLKAVVDNANFALTQLNDPELTELFAGDPMLANHPAVVRLLAKVGGSLREDGLRVTGAPVNAGDPRTPGEAQAALKAFEAENGALLFHMNPDRLSPAEQTKRDSLLEKRLRLYANAFPSQ